MTDTAYRPTRDLETLLDDNWRAWRVPPGQPARIVPQLDSVVRDHTLSAYPNRFLTSDIEALDIDSEIQSWVNMRVTPLRAVAGKINALATSFAAVFVAPILFSALALVGVDTSMGFRGGVQLFLVGWALLRGMALVTKPDQFTGRHAAAVEWMMLHTREVRDPHLARRLLHLVDAYAAEFAMGQDQHGRLVDKVIDIADDPRLRGEGIRLEKAMSAALRGAERDRAAYDATAAARARRDADALLLDATSRRGEEFASAGDDVQDMLRH